MFREKNGGTIFDLKVRPSSGSVSLKVKKGVVYLSVTNPPVRNLANREIIKVLSDFFETRVEIEKSMPGYRKVILVYGMNEQQVREKLGMKWEM